VNSDDRVVVTVDAPGTTLRVTDNHGATFRPCADDRVVRVIMTMAARVRVGDVIDMSDGLHKVTDVAYLVDEDGYPLVRIGWSNGRPGWATFTEQAPDGPMLVRAGGV
jgi:hypothetical protein